MFWNLHKENGNLKINGFTLVEILAVIVIFSIIISITAASVLSSVENEKTEVCNINRTELEKKYEMYLSLSSLTHNERNFINYASNFNKSICPINGEISYIDGKVQCSKHSETEHLEEVPYL